MKGYISVLMLMIFCAFSCGEPEPINTEPEIMVDEFDLVGKWDFVSVSGEGQIFGVPRSDEDENPIGFIEFFDNGLGYSDFSLELLGETIAKDENIQWERLDKFTLDIEEEDGAHEIWNFIIGNDNKIQAEWELDFGPGNQATITMNLSR